jgi:hypothetical protein
MSFAELYRRWSWRAIAGCPGRFVLCDAQLGAPATWLDATVTIHCFSVAGARDPVLVAALSDGGIISYARPDGSFVHTLNTPEGFARKLEQLGIALATESTSD